MDETTAILSFGALAQESRLKVVRLLVRSGADGMAAGDIARYFDVPHNTMSSHLAVLARAGLVRPRKQGRSVIYVVDFDGMRSLLSFLMEDCCRGRPEVCAPLIASVLPDLCEAE